MKRRDLGRLAAAMMMAAALVGLPRLALAADEAPDALIKRLSDEVMAAIKADRDIKSGDTAKIMALVDTTATPTSIPPPRRAAAGGPPGRPATPEQKKRLQDEFKTLLIRTYAGALSQVDDQTISMKPFRAAPTDTDVVVRSEIRGRGEPIQLEYRMEKTPGQGAGWRIYNLNVLGVWLVDTYRSQFGPEINAKGVDGLIATLQERNRSNASGAANGKKG